MVEDKGEMNFLEYKERVRVKDTVILCRVSLNLQLDTCSLL